MFNSIFLIVVVVPTLMCSFVNSMRFNLKSDQPKCITEDIKSNAMTVGKYSVVNLNEDVTIRRTENLYFQKPVSIIVGVLEDFQIPIYDGPPIVRSPIGNNYHFGDHVDSGNFAFTTAEAGDYTACFSVLEQKPSITVTVDFEWRSGVADRDWYKVAKKDKIEVMEYELQRLYDTVTLIHDEMFYLRGREEEMQDLNKATDNKMFTFIFLSIIVCLSVAGLQLWHLKIFFERKKLL